MVGNMLGKDNKRHRNISHRDCTEVAGVQVGQPLGGFQEGEVRHLDEGMQ